MKQLSSYQDQLVMALMVLSPKRLLIFPANMHSKYRTHSNRQTLAKRINVVQQHPLRATLRAPITRPVRETMIPPHFLSQWCCVRDHDTLPMNGFYRFPTGPQKPGHALPILASSDGAMPFQKQSSLSPRS